ncbi:cytokine receptor common subunit gamma-like [Micropterus salmoides]|uniref:cytokine receptor common subunit gamma-like n=1 Tax=Micropterus salmoides TaxID=27706 RepID=UPI0018EBB631|nr:cytokine receptor common subunit gamma-like [Micropterus salmoides]
MATRLLLLLFLTGPVIAKEPPDVDCLVVNLQYVHCSWHKQGTPEVNYTFYSRFSNVNEVSECETYVLENSTNIGCNQPYGDRLNRFYRFYSELVHGEKRSLQEHELKTKVKLNPPTNLTIKNESDSNLWVYWNQTATNCVESEIRIRTNNKKWEMSKITVAKQNYCINLPSSSSRYELQVRSKVGYNCGDSDFWSDWSHPVVWGSNNSTDINKMNGSMSVWTLVLCVVGAITLILMVMTLLHHERLRIILIPMVPKPSLIPHDIEDWFQLSKGLKESFKANYNERACPVREYCHVSQSDSESSGSSTFSFTTDQTDCSIFIPVDESDLCSSSTSAALVSSEEAEQVSV